MNTHDHRFAFPATRATVSILTIVVLSLVFAATASAATPQHAWSTAFAANNYQAGAVATVDAAGDVIIAGFFFEEIDLGGGALTSIGGASTFLAKFTPSGTHIWSKALDDDITSSPYSVWTDAGSNVYLAGAFADTLDVDGTVLVSAGGLDTFLARFTSGGVLSWAQRFGDTDEDWIAEGCVDVSNNIVLVGAFQDSLDFGGGNMISAGSYDVFVTKFTTSGSHLGSQRFGDASSQQGIKVVTDASGNIYIFGNFEGTIDFGTGGLTSAGFTDVFIAKSSALGVPIWSNRFGDSSEQTARGLAIDGSSNLAITGLTRGDIDFGSGTLTGSSDGDIYLAKFDASGANIWGNVFAGNQEDLASGLEFTPAGKLVLGGRMYGDLNLGGGLLTSAGGAATTDVFLSLFDASGTHEWSDRFGELNNDHCDAVAVSSGSFYSLGSFWDQISLGGDTLYGVDKADAYLAKFTFGTPPTVASAIPDTVVTENNPPIIAYRDLNSVFTDAEDGSALSFTIESNSNPSLVSVSIDSSYAIDLSFGTNQTGSATIVVRATDSDLLTVEDSFVVNVIPGFPDAPQIGSIVDVGNDQGRSVRIQFQRANQDKNGAATPVLQYEAYRRIDTLPALVSASPARAVVLENWELAASIPAHTEDIYNMIVPTLADSTIAKGMHWSVFFIRAATAAPGTFFDSTPDSGYSRDNLAPGAPQGLTYASDQLSWDEAPEADFQYFSVYGGAAPDFGSATLIDHTAGTGLDVGAYSHDYYFVTATDFSGNEGPPTTFNTLTGVVGPQRYPLSLSAHPNPFNPSTTITYSVPEAGAVSIRVFDVTGRVVSTLVDGEHRTPGRYQAPYRPDSTSGVYFVRLETPAGMRTFKLVMMK